MISDCISFYVRVRKNTTTTYHDAPPEFIDLMNTIDLHWFLLITAFLFPKNDEERKIRRTQHFYFEGNLKILPLFAVPSFSRIEYRYLEHPSNPSSSSSHFSAAVSWSLRVVAKMQAPCSTRKRTMGRLLQQKPRSFARREALASPAKFPQHSWLLAPLFAMGCSGATYYYWKVLMF